MIRIPDRHTGEILLELFFDSLAGCDLREYDLRHANLGGQDLRRCIFDGMDLEEIELSDAWLDDASMKKVRLVEAVVTGIHAPRLQLTGAHIEMTTFANSQIPEVEFSQAIFRGVVNFSDSVARRAKFRCIRELGRPILVRTDFQDADFSGTDITTVSPIDRVGANWHGTIFQHLMEEN